MSNSRIDICNIIIDNISMEESIQRVAEFILSKNYSYIVTPNIDHIVRLQKDAYFKKIYDGASLVLADGVPILWAARFLSAPLKEKISGSDLFPKLCEASAKNGWKVFFLGGGEGAAENAADVLKTQYPLLQVVGTYCPPLGFDDDENKNRIIINMIKDVKADILFVGLGSPKQEKWIYKYKDQYQVPVSIGVGVSFEFVAGVVKRAPKWMQKIGLEWFWRLIMEPKRLWKRYLIDDPVFFWLVLKQKLKTLRSK